MSISGYAQGTSFMIIIDSSDTSPQEDILRLFRDIDLSMSLYDSTSRIVAANGRDTLVRVDQWFADVHALAMEVYNATDGAFDPSVYPLVQYWGFGAGKYSHPEETDSNLVLNLLKKKGFDRTSIVYKKDADGKDVPYYRKPFADLQIDFNGIAQGYTTDKIAELLDEKGFLNYMVEVGGETRTKGVNQHGRTWRIGIDKPQDNTAKRELIAIAEISNMSVATSGSYRKFYEKDGTKYSHTINPATGYPVQHPLLSATVIIPNCGLADAYATAFMVMGPQKAQEFIRTHRDINLYLIYTEPGNSRYEHYISDGLQNILTLTGK